MSAGSRFEYHWQDGVRFRKPTKMSAPGEPPLMSWPQLKGDNCKLTYRGSWAEYVDHLMTWVQGMLDDEGIFPSQMGTSVSNMLLWGAEESDAGRPFVHNGSQALLFRRTFSPQ